MIVTGAHGSKRPNSIQPGNREWATVIEGICALGWAIPPLIILTGRVHQTTCYTGVTIPSGWAISVSTNGWTTDSNGSSISIPYKATIIWKEAPANN
jgi:hypothetical protein